VARVGVIAPTPTKCDVLVRCVLDADDVLDLVCGGHYVGVMGATCDAYRAGMINCRDVHVNKSVLTRVQARRLK
jgi:hypothetical protein